MGKLKSLASKGAKETLWPGHYVTAIALGPDLDREWGLPSLFVREYRTAGSSFSRHKIIFSYMQEGYIFFKIRRVGTPCHLVYNFVDFSYFLCPSSSKTQMCVHVCI